MRALGAKVIEIEGPFDPEGGAYEGHAAHEGHDHATHEHRDHHDHDHAHHDHGHDQDHGQALITTMITPITMVMRTITTIDTIDNDRSGSLPLLAWLSPFFPVGAFAYSHGLEWAVEADDIGDAAALAQWLDDLLPSARSAATPS